MAKKYKGRAIIEITNVKTGDKKVQIEDNMVTNAIFDIFSHNPNGVINFNDINTDGSANIKRYTPFDCLSGISLFDINIEEKPTNTSIPKIPIAFAGNNENTTASKVKGSLNKNGCKILDNGFQFVWEFNTEQGNGTVKSIGLCNPLALNGMEFADGKNNDKNGDLFKLISGYSNYQNYRWYDAFMNNDSGKDPIFDKFSQNVSFIDAKTGKWYKLSCSDSGTNIKIEECMRGIYKIPVGQKNVILDEKTGNKIEDGYYAKQFKENNVTVQSPINFGELSGNIGISMSFYNGFIYLFSIKTGTNSILITKIDMSNFTATQETKTYAGLSFYANTASQMEYPGYTPKFGMDMMMVKDSLCFNFPYLYAVNNNNKKQLIKINIQDETDAMELPIGKISNNFMMKTSGVVLGNFYINHFNNSDNIYIISLSENLVLNGRTSINTGRSANHRMSFYDIDNNYIITTKATTQYNEKICNYGLTINPFYMATINNVSEFTKTTDDQMRITYTITEVEE